jgi:putative peptidoglycan lipid II flippase
MVKKILKFFQRETRNMSEAAFILGSLTFFSQLLALVRDRLFAHHLGVGISLDIYNTAFRIPDILFAVMASVVSMTILLPFFSEKLYGSEGGKKAAKVFLDTLFSLFFIVLIVVSGVLFFLAPLLVPYIAPGFDQGSLELLVTTTRVLLLSPFLLGLSSLFATVTQTYNKFLLYALSPVLYNIGIIIGVLFLYKSFGIIGIAWGVVLGAFLHMSVHIPVLIRTGFIPTFSFCFDWQSVKKVLSVALPRTLTLALSKITFLVLGALASLIGFGSISIFQFAFNLQSVPLALVGMSFSVAAFPILVKNFTLHNQEAFLRSVIEPVRYIIFWSLPIIVIFIVLRAHVVRLILGTGIFGWNDTRLTAAALALFALSVIAQSLSMLFVRAYYAAGRTYFPFFIHIVGAAVAIGFGMFAVYTIDPQGSFWGWFESLMRVQGVPGTTVLMLPLAYSLGAITTSVLLWISFTKTYVKNYVHDLHRTIWQSLGAAVSMAVASYVILQFLAPLVPGITTLALLSQAIASLSGGILMWVLFLVIVKNKEWQLFTDIIKRNFFKKVDIITPSQDGL